MVLASGTIINANASVHSDLWRALKGGSSNFGIVPRFDLEAFPAENLNMETRIYAREHSDELIDAIADFAGLNQSMANNALISMMTYDPKIEDSTIMVVEVNTRNKANSTAYDAFNRIPLLHPATTKSVSLVEAANSTQLSGKNR